jgi:hypothetical protein
MFIRAKQENLITGRICIVDLPPAAGSSSRAPVGPRATTDGDIEIPLDFAERIWFLTHFNTARLHTARDHQPSCTRPPHPEQPLRF